MPHHLPEQQKCGRGYLEVRLHANALVRWRGRVCVLLHVLLSLLLHVLLSVLLHALRYVQTGMPAYTKSEIVKASVRKEANKATRASRQVRNEANKPKQAANQTLHSTQHSWRRCMVEGLSVLVGALSPYLVLSLPRLLGPLSYKVLYHNIYSLLLSQNIYYTNLLPSQARQGVI